jgi:hypothetical protein
MAGCGIGLASALRDFAAYNDGRHILIVELKELGGDPNGFPEYLDRIRRMTDASGMTGHLSISSLSPGILMAANAAMPDVPLILNAGPTPMLKRMKGGYKVFTFGKTHEVVLAGTDDIIIRADGYGKLTGYLLARVPAPLAKVMREQKARGDRFGGVITLSTVTWIATVLDNLGMRGKARDLRREYAAVLDELGVGRMATTYNQRFGCLPGFSHLRPENQTMTLKRDIGKDALIYATAPNEWAEKLPAFCSIT